MKKLEVWFCGWGQRWQLGTLADNGVDLLFEYSAAALAQGIEFSPLGLPLRAAAFGGFPAFQARLPGFLADALPDGWGMLLMDRLFRQQGWDAARLSPLDRLAFIGERAMGALAFRPAQDTELPQQDSELLSLAQQSQRLLAGQSSSALAELARLGGSPHGARPKVLLQFDPQHEQISTDPNAPGSAWLIKFQAQGEHKEACAIEYLYAQLARDCGLSMPRTHYFDLSPKLAGFGIERFDRDGPNRVPLHTLAGALGKDFRLPSESYASLLRITRLLCRDQREIEKAFERCVFNVLFNNRDDHTKNFSFRMGNTMRWQLAPCYDLTFNLGPGGEHQMDVYGEGRVPGRPHLLKLAQTEGLDTVWAGRVIERMATVAGSFKAQAKAAPIRPATRKILSDAIEANRGRMK
jgi:serine/threonine-protein kinase HipA